MHAEQSEGSCLSHQTQIKITTLVPVGDVRLDPPLNEFANCCLDIPLFLSQKMINAKQLQRCGSAHRSPISASASAPFSISSSLSNTCSAAVPNGTKLSSLATRKITLDQGGDYTLPDASTVPGLVDHQHPASRFSRRDDICDRKWCEPAQVEDPGTDAAGSESAGDAEAHGDTVAKADHGEDCRSVPVASCSTDRHMIILSNCEPGLIAWLVEIALVVQRNRLEE